MNRIPLPKRPLKCLHLGDSYTIGEGLPLSEAWPHQLWDRMENAGMDIAETSIIAQTGWTSGDLLEALQLSKLPPFWHFITICIGVNNQYKALASSAYEKDLTALVENAKGLLADQSSKVLVLSIPDWSVSPFAQDRDGEAIASEIDRFNEIVANVAEACEVSFADWNPLIRKLGESETAFVKDGLHPNAQQHGHWAEFIVKRCRPR